MDKTDFIIGPFDPNRQQLLKDVDKVCREQSAIILKEARKAALEGKDPEFDVDTQGWMAIITAYGLLYNRAVQAGWIEDMYYDGNAPNVVADDDTI